MTRHFSPLHRFLHQQFLRLPQPVRPLRLILTAYFVIAVLYALATPAFEVSDEPLHVALAQHLANDSSLPIQQTGLSMEQAPWQQEGSQPPLYYAILAAMVQPFDRSDFALTWRHNPHSRQGRADAFDGVRGGNYQARDGLDWLEGYRDQLARSPLEAITVKAAE